MKGTKILTRKIHSFIAKDLQKKIVLLSGPRQTGKTTLAKSLNSKFEYLNFDSTKDRKIIIEESWNREVSLIIFDELHKMKNWKRWLKGIYDTEDNSPAIIVTGSARLDVAKKMGDSLAGRHFLYRLHPLTLRDLKGTDKLEKIFKRLLSQGGFPEPYFSKDAHFYEKWKRSHLDIILRQDLLNIENVKRIADIEMLIQLLRERVGTLISYQSLAEDLQVDSSTVKRWLLLLENLFVIFRISPFTRNIPRSLLKAGKYYFYDSGQVIGDNGAKFENLVANHLLSYLQFEQDTKGRNISLSYLRNKDGDEVDFAIIENNKIVLMLEAKWSDDSPSKSFLKLCPKGEKPKAVQLVAELDREKDYPFGVRIASAINWLSEINF